MNTYSKISNLPLVIESYSLEGLSQKTSNGEVRHTTIVKLGGEGHVGLGEDVTYDSSEQLKFQKNGSKLNLKGSYTLDTISSALDNKLLFEKPPDQKAYLLYRRWAIESAALSLALKQSGKTLENAINLQLSPMNFVSSIRLGNPSSASSVKDRLKINSGLRFKLDIANDWTDELIEELATTNSIDVFDFKGYYKGTPVDIETDPSLYAKVLKAFPDAWIEDPDVTEQTRSILEPNKHRISWDAPIHSVGDIGEMPFKTPILNVKPSRFGTIKKLFETYDYCKGKGIKMYGGGQFELGVGRTQAQYLASIFHPDGPNDLAPSLYNLPELPKNAPKSPIIVEKF